MKTRNSGLLSGPSLPHAGYGVHDVHVPGELVDISYFLLACYIAHMPISSRKENNKVYLFSNSDSIGIQSASLNH